MYEINNFLEKNYTEYAQYVIQNRAIPNIEDGLKPVQRRIIWSMYLDGLLYNKNRTKCSNACGSVMRFSPHGDSSIFQAMVRLANDSVTLPLIDGKGAFSSCTTRDIGSGASRYLEARLSKLACTLLDDIDKNNVSFKDNYDNTRKEPIVLPTKLPLVLCNPQIGIAVGISTSIPSFNSKEVIDNTIRYIKNEPLDLLYPDFATFGNVIKDEEMAKQIFETGKGSFKLRAEYKIENDTIIITSIPYTTTREVIIEKVIDLIKIGKIKEIIDINDFTGIQGLEINIQCKKNTNKEELMERLFKLTTLEDNFTCNFIVLVDNKPKTLGIKDIIKEWHKFRISTIKKEINFDLDNLEKNINILEGLEKIVNDIDKVISIIRSSKSENEVLTSLKEKYNLNNKQLDYICKIKLINLNSIWLNNKIKLKNDFINKYKNLQEMYNSNDLINNRIINELEEIKKEFCFDRKTKIIEKPIIKITENKKEIDNYPCYIAITKENYVKKLIRIIDIEKIKTKDNDVVTEIKKTNNNATLLVFTNKQNCYKILLDDLQKNAPSDIGNYIPAIISLEKDEQIISMQITENYSETLVNIYQNSFLAKISLKSFETKNKQSKLKNSLANEKLIKQFVITDDIDIICKSSNNKILVVNTKEFNEKTTRNSSGQILMKQKDDNYLDFVVLENELDKYKFEDINYYKSKRGNIGNLLKKNDEIKNY